MNNKLTLTVPTAKELKAFVQKIPVVGVITDQKSYDHTLEVYKVVGVKAKELKARKDLVLSPLKIATKNFNSLFKPYEEELSLMESALQNELNNYLAKVKEEEATKIAKIKADSRIKNPITKEVKIQQASEMIPDTNTFTIKVLKVVNADKIPHEYYDLNESRVLAALKAGVKVPGAEIVEETRVRR